MSKFDIILPTDSADRIRCAKPNPDADDSVLARLTSTTAPDGFAFDIRSSATGLGLLPAGKPVVDLFKRMFRKDAALSTPPSPATANLADRQDLQNAARRAQIANSLANDLLELQEIAMAELALRKEQDAAKAENAAAAHPPAETADLDGNTPFGKRVLIV